MRLTISLIVLVIFSLGILAAYSWMSTGSGRTAAFSSLSSFPVPITKPAVQEQVRDFTASLESAMHKEAIPGLSVAIVYDGQVIMTTGFGTTDIAQPTSVRDETVFRIASLSKGFAAVLVGILVDDGLLAWDDPVSKYLPNFRLHTKEATQQLRIRHLLTHTTGLPRHAYSNLLNQSVPYREIVPMLRDVPLAHTPGTWYNYQNVAYSLIGDIVEAVSEVPYDSLLKQRLFIPLGMDEASTGFAAIDQLKDAARPHAPDAHGYHRITFNNKWYDVSPAAGINASASDLGQYLLLLMGHYPELLSNKSLQTITSKQIDVSPRENVMRAWSPMSESGYGLGWRNVGKQGRQIIFHGGFVNGYRAEIGFCPEEKIGIALLSNGANYFMRDALPSFFTAYFDKVDLNRQSN